MIISVTELKSRLLEIIREIERNGTVVEVERHGEVVARLVPAAAPPSRGRPWERLYGTGSLLASAEESVLDDQDLEAAR
ncbi:MAG TPA: type II toxin-antitoxin system Phd/YefM family antitoxin [Thermoanaerobaculia bacterium]|nr:type II toxin-antitoxin system Phd/YefM family antitoxin [Thermoanaerobaculia bacterium]